MKKIRSYRIVVGITLVLLSFFSQLLSTIVQSSVPVTGNWTQLFLWLALLLFLFHQIYDQWVQIKEKEDKINELEAEIRERANQDYLKEIMRTICEMFPPELQLRACVFLIGKDETTGRDVLYFHAMHGHYPRTEYTRKYEYNRGVVGYAWYDGTKEPIIGDMPKPDQAGNLKQLRRDWRLTHKQMQATKDLQAIIAFNLFYEYQGHDCLVGVLAIDSKLPVMIADGANENPDEDEENKQATRSRIVIKKSDLEVVRVFADSASRFLPVRNVILGVEDSRHHLVQVEPRFLT